MTRMKRILSTLLSIALTLSLCSGCGMFTNYKAIAEQALEDKYGEEFICHDTWDEGGSDFFARLSPSYNENICFQACILKSKKVISDAYIEKIVAEQCVDNMKSHFDKISTYYSYYTSINSQANVFVSKEQATIENFFAREDLLSPNLYVVVCFDNDSIICESYSDEYDIFMDILNAEELSPIQDIYFVLYFVPNHNVIEYTDYFRNNEGIKTSIDNLSFSDNKINFAYINQEFTMSKENYIELRKEMAD